MPKVGIEIPRENIAEFCRKWKICKLALFGSVLRSDFRADSDIDVIIDFEPGVTYGLFDLIYMENELKEIFGRGVDLLTGPMVERSRNYIRRKAIQSSMEVIYAA